MGRGEVVEIGSVDVLDEERGALIAGERAILEVSDLEIIHVSGEEPVGREHAEGRGLGSG